MDKKIEDMASRLNIKHVLKKYPYQMSGGEKQRVASARAIITNPKLILADEPTGNLDSKNSQIIMDELTKLHKAGNTILMVTHNPDLLSYASRVIHMRDGQIERDEDLVENSAFRVTKRTISSHKAKYKGTRRSKRLTKSRRSKWD